jgi:gas vesicle protein
METKSLIEGIAVGAVAGVVATLLLASKSGQETREGIKGHVEEIKDALVKRLESAQELTQAQYEEMVKTLVGEFEAAGKIPADEAKEIATRLREGYEAIKETACQHACGAKKPAAKPRKVAVK